MFANRETRHRVSNPTAETGKRTLLTLHYRGSALIS